MSFPTELCAQKLSRLRAPSREGEQGESCPHEAPQIDGSSQDQILQASHTCSVIFVTAFLTNPTSAFWKEHHWVTAFMPMQLVAFQFNLLIREMKTRASFPQARRDTR